ncbi:36903_t:CDS:2, partial [Gigaspora margarita]
QVKCFLSYFITCNWKTHSIGSGWWFSFQLEVDGSEYMSFRWGSDSDLRSITQVYELRLGGSILAIVVTRTETYI